MVDFVPPGPNGGWLRAEFASLAIRSDPFDASHPVVLQFPLGTYSVVVYVREVCVHVHILETLISGDLKRKKEEKRRQS